MEREEGGWRGGIAARDLEENWADGPAHERVRRKRQRILRRNLEVQSSRDFNYDGRQITDDEPTKAMGDRIGWERTGRERGPRTQVRVETWSPKTSRGKRHGDGRGRTTARAPNVYVTRRDGRPRMRRREPSKRFTTTSMRHIQPALLQSSDGLDEMTREHAKQNGHNNEHEQGKGTKEMGWGRRGERGHTQKKTMQLQDKPSANTASQNHSYNRYIAVASRALRRSLKEDKRILAERRGEAADIKFAKWSVSNYYKSLYISIGEGDIQRRQEAEERKEENRPTIWLRLPRARQERKRTRTGNGCNECANQPIPKNPGTCRKTGQHRT